MSDLRNRLRKEFRDNLEFRHDYTSSFLNSSIAAQIRLLRRARRMTQKQLGAAIGTPQPGVARLEDASYEGWSIGTLRKLARAFDVALTVRFDSFGGALRYIDTFGEESLTPPAFEDDPVFASEPPNYAESTIGILEGRRRFVSNRGQERTPLDGESSGSTAEGTTQHVEETEHTEYTDETRRVS